MGMRQHRLLTGFLFASFAFACDAPSQKAAASKADAEAPKAEAPKAEAPKAEVPEAEAPEAEAAPAGEGALPDLPKNRVEYDLPVVGDKAGGFDVSFAILRKGNAQTGQGSLTVFGPEVKPGDKGAAKDWQDVCDTRLNAFSDAHGLMLDLNGIDPFPTPGPNAKVRTGSSFRMQLGRWRLPSKAFRERTHEADVRILSADEDLAVVGFRWQEPGQPGSLRGQVEAKICPPSS